MRGSPVIQLQLLLVRSLFDRALVAAQENSEIGNMIALLLADVAVETVIKQVLTDRQVVFGKEDKIGDLLRMLQAAVPTMKDQPENAMARRLRESRNPIQHSGSIPAPTSVAAHLHDAASFITAVMQKAFGIDFLAVSATGLVRSPDVRLALERAEEHLGRGDADAAAQHVFAAFEVLRIRWAKWVRRALGGDYVRLEPYLSRKIPHHVVHDVFGDHPDAIEPHGENSAAELGLFSMGYSVGELLAVRDVGLRAKAVSSAAHDGPPLGGPAADRAAVQRAIDVVARNTWRLETLHPELFTKGPVPTADETDD